MIGVIIFICIVASKHYRNSYKQRLGNENAAEVYFLFRKKKTYKVPKPYRIECIKTQIDSCHFIVFCFFYGTLMILLIADCFYRCISFFLRHLRSIFSYKQINEILPEVTINQKRLINIILTIFRNSPKHF
jgi:hypothetical protein